jgi:hypothetical protein
MVQNAYSMDICILSDNISYLGSWYCNTLATYGVENFLICFWSGPKDAKFERSDLYSKIYYHQIILGPQIVALLLFPPYKFMLLLCCYYQL